MLNDKIKNLGLTSIEKTALYNYLKESNAEVEQKERNVYSVLKDLILDIYKNYIIDPTLLRLWPKAKRICSSSLRIEYSGEDLGIGDVYHVFPNDILQYSRSISLTEGRYNKINDFVSLSYENIVPGLRESMIRLRDVISKIPESKLESIRNATYDYYSAKFEVRNFLREYIVNGVFLKNIRTWGQLYRLNQDWYEFLITKYSPSVKEDKPDYSELQYKGSAQEKLEYLRKSLGDLGIIGN